MFRRLGIKKLVLALQDEPPLSSIAPARLLFTGLRAYLIMKGLPVTGMARILLISSLCLVWMFPAMGQTALSQRMASTAMNALYSDPVRNDPRIPPKWTYDFGVVLKGIEG